MPLRLDVKKKLNTHTERVKCVDFHPTDPWVLSALYSGVVMIHDWETQSLVKSLEVSQLPIRCAKFITRKQWIIAAGDDMLIRVYNYNTLEKVKELEGHTDYIRYLAVHATLPFILSASDDMTVKLWDWDKDWIRTQSFEGHAHYVMMCQWNPKDPHIFATASLDRTIKIWGIQTSAASSGAPVTTPHFVLNGHERGVNCIEYSPTGEKPYIVSGSDDKTVRVWDYQTKQCIATLSGHSRNVSAAVFHPKLPVIISGAEDGTLKIWHSATYRLETTVAYHMDRAWTISTLKSSNAVAVGYDEGTLVIKLGSETPLASMQGGKIIWAKGSDIQTANLKFVDDSLYSDGERLPLPVKDLGACEVFPQTMSHHPNGRFVAVCGDEEYIIYTAQALRSKAYGKALEFEWSSEGHFAIRDESKITVFHNFKEHRTMRPSFPVEAIFGGRLLGLRCSDFICFYDWNECRLIRKIDVAPKHVWWNETGELVCLACADMFYVLRHDKEVVQAAIVGGAADTDDGIEIAFDLVSEVNESVQSATWVSECLVFVTSGLRLQSYISGQLETIAFLERNLYILGYLPDNNKLYLIDNELCVLSYVLHLAVVEYMCAICRKDFDIATHRFGKIPPELHNRVARFLEHQGHKEDALAVSKDQDHQFELALSLGKLEMCASIIKNSAAASVAAAASRNAALGLNDSAAACGAAQVQVNNQRWKQLGDAALERGKLELAEGCFKEASDSSGLMLLAVSTGNETLLKLAAQKGREDGKTNVALISHLILGDVDRCVDLLIETDRLPEAAFFSRTYCPSHMSRVVKLWKEDLKKVNEQLAASLADPEEHPELFGNLESALKAEKLLRERRLKGGIPLASQYIKHRDLLDVDIVDDIEKVGINKVRDLFLRDIEVDHENEHLTNHVSTTNDLLGDLTSAATAPPPPSVSPSSTAAAAPAQRNGHLQTQPPPPPPPRAENAAALPASSVSSSATPDVSASRSPPRKNHGVAATAATLTSSMIPPASDNDYDSGDLLGDYKASAMPVVPPVAVVERYVPVTGIPDDEDD